ncbi:MAG: sensor histidine kinase [Bacteroidetes bacterium]|nr:sensor histidine kinase [Bacteroidota bacterium]
MKYFLLYNWILLACLLNCRLCYSRDKQIDSLKALLSTHPNDTTYIDVLNSIARALVDKGDYVSALKYADEVSTFAESKLNAKTDPDLKQKIVIDDKITRAIKQGMVVSFNTIGILNDQKGDFTNALNYYFKALKVSEEINYKKGMARCYNHIGIIYDKQGDYNTAMVYQLKSLKIKEEINDKFGIARSFANIASIYKKKGDYTKALDYAFRATIIEKENNGKEGTASSYNNIGSIYYDQGNITMALEYYLKSLRINEENVDIKGTADSYHNIGILYKDQGDYPKALEYYFKSLKTARTIGSKDHLSLLFGDIGNIYYHQLNYSKALEYHQKALKLADEIGYKEGINNAYINIGNVFESTGDYSKSEEYYLKSLKTAEEMGDRTSIAISCGNIAVVFFDQGNYFKALEYANKGLALGKEVGYLDLIKDIQETLSNIYLKTNQPAKALEHYKEYITARDSLLNEKNTKKITQAEMNYEFKKRQAIEKAEQEKKDAIVKAEISKQKTVRNSLIIIFTLLLATSIMLITSYRRKIKTTQLLAQKNEEIHKQKVVDLLEKQRLKSMKDLIIGQEVERHRIARELHDGMGGIMAGIKLKLIKINSTFEKKQDLESVINNVDAAYNEIRTISHNLTPPQLTNTAFTEVVKTFIEEFKPTTKLDIHLEFIEEEKLNEVSEKVQVEVYRIIQELIKNILKHSKASKVVIDLSKYENELNLLVEDNGVGFDSSKKNTGIGLRNIQSRVEALSGVLSIDSKTGWGSTFNISIPC